MKKIITIAILILMLSTCLAFAAQKYNFMKGKWETTSNDSELQYNYMENDWSYQPKGGNIEYNAMEGTWDWVSEQDNN